MKLMTWHSTLLATFLLIFNGCGDVVDSINESLLDIKEDNKQDSINNTSGNSNSSTGGSSGVNVDINDSDTNVTTSSGGESSTSSGDSSPTSSSSGNSNSTTSSSSGSSNSNNDDSNMTFSLSFPDFKDKKAIKLDLGFNEEQKIVISVTPIQPSLKLELKDETNGVLEKAFIENNGLAQANNGYKYSFDIKSGTTAGHESFRLELASDDFQDFLDIDVNIIKQIKITSARSKYNLLVKGDEQEIIIDALNIKGNPLEFSIQEYDEVNDRDIIELSYSGLKRFTKDTNGSVHFKFLAKGLKVGTEKITIRVTDTTFNYVDSIPITLESSRANRSLFKDLYECGSNYSNVNLKEYEITQDSNTPTSLTGTTSNDKALTLLSTYDLKYDIGNEFSTIMVFHPRQITYNQDVFGQDYIYLNSGNKQIATIFYGPSLSGKEYFVKYYDENTNSVICESNKFPPLVPINKELVIKEKSDNDAVPSTGDIPDSQ